ncbi:hypothetical protein LINGRAPRIM_LOCUS703 [Linum grandiflorum]
MNLIFLGLDFILLLSLDVGLNLLAVLEILALPLNSQIISKLFTIS